MKNFAGPFATDCLFPVYFHFNSPQLDGIFDATFQLSSKRTLKDGSQTLHYPIVCSSAKLPSNGGKSACLPFLHSDYSFFTILSQLSCECALNVLVN